MRVVIATGTERYADPWHPFAQTSERVATIMRDSGAEVIGVMGVDDALQNLDGVDLLIVNAGDPWRHGGSPAAVPPPSVAGLDAALSRGIGILALHSSVSSLRDYASWAPAIGGVWVPTVSMHPPADTARIRMLEHELTRGMRDFDVFDERYCLIQMMGESNAVAEHKHSGASFPTAWTRLHGHSRIACSLLGHDGRSYDSAGNRELIRALASWAGGRSSSERPRGSS